MKTKTCTGCKAEKPVGDFYKRAGGGKLRPRCRSCVNAENTKRRTENLERYREIEGKSYRSHYDKNREARLGRWRVWALKSIFGLSLEQFLEMVRRQDGKCGICAVELKMVSSRGQRDAACVDHDHRTGAVRGLLCSKCNSALGLFNDDVSLLERAAAYLRQK